MRIVAHNGATIWGGAEIATVKLLSGLAARGHDAILLCNSPLVKEEARNRGVDSEVMVIGGDLAFHDALKLRNRLVGLAPDAFIVATYKKLFLAALGARMAGVERVIARIGLETDTPRSLKYRIALRRWTSAVVVNSSAMVAPFASLDGFDAERVHVIHNGVTAPVTRRNPLLIRDEIGIPGDAFVIGTVARLAIQKRIDRMVEAVSLLPSDVHCIIAGEGTRRAEIETEIDKRGIRDRVHLIGHRNDVPDIMSALDVFVLSSDTEGLSNSMLEAMSLRKPVISTDVSGARDALARRDGDGPSGIIVDFSAGAIADAVNQLRADAALRARLGESAGHRAVRSFSFEVMLDRWEALLASA